MPDLVFENVYFFNMNKAVQNQQLSLKYVSVKNKDTRTRSLTSLILNIVNIDIFNIEQLSHFILVLKVLTLSK